MELDQSFLEIHQQFFKQKVSFSTCCSLFLNFELTKSQTSRLVILYILYSQYANLPLEQNPFLDFFLNLLDNGTAIERDFIYSILKGTITNISHLTPQQVCNQQLCIEKDQAQRISRLKLKVARLIDDPTIVVLNDSIVELLSVTALNRLLTLSENEALRRENLSDYPVSEYISPSQLPHLINLNQFLASDILPRLLDSDKRQEYLQAILNTAVTSSSIETLHHIIVHERISLSQDFIHYYISNSIRSCDQIKDDLKKDKQVKQVARFIQSLLEQKIISMADYFVEVQAFCVPFMRIKGIVQLFRLASNEARNMIE